MASAAAQPSVNPVSASAASASPAPAMAPAAATASAVMPASNPAGPVVVPPLTTATAGVPIAPATPGSGGATAALVLGILAMIAWLVPLIGLPVSIAALVLGITHAHSAHRGRAVAGIVLACISFPLIVLSGYLGYKYAQEQAGQTPSSSPAGVTQAAGVLTIDTPCYGFSLGKSFGATTDGASCEAKAIDPDSNQSYEIKAIPANGITAAGFTQDVQLDLQYVAKQTKGTIASQNPTTFLDGQAYKGVVKTPDGFTTVIEYLYRTPGYTVSGKSTTVFAIAYTTKASNTTDIKGIDQSWKWK